MWSKICALVVFSVLVAGCGRTVTVACPPLVQYDQTFMSQLADELTAAPTSSAMARAIVDYRQLRDIIRACH